MRLRRRLVLEVGASAPLILRRARGTGSAGLGTGESTAASAMGGGSETVLDLKEEREKNLSRERLLFFSKLLSKIPKAKHFLVLSSV